MEPVTPALVDEVWGDLTRWSPERVQAEAQEFLARQPHVAAFAQELTGTAEPAVQQAAFGLAFLLFKVLERSRGRPLPPLDEERIARAWEANRHRAAGAEIRLDPLDAAHPSLSAYILDVFYAGQAAACDAAVRANLFLLLKTLTEALDIAAVEESTP